MVAAETQPQSLPLLIARTRGVSVSATSRVPAMSIERGRSGSRDSDTKTTVSAMHSAATPASTQNSPCHPETSTRKPPSNGPAAAPTAAAAPHSDTARSCASPLFATDSRLSPHARIVAPAAPWIARPAITMPPEFESAMRMQDATKSSSPSWKMRRRPNTSPRDPEVTITAAPTRE